MLGRGGGAEGVPTDESHPQDERSEAVRGSDPSSAIPHLYRDEPADTAGDIQEAPTAETGNSRKASRVTYREPEWARQGAQRKGLLSPSTLSRADQEFPRPAGDGALQERPAGHEKTPTPGYLDVLIANGVLTPEMLVKATELQIAAGQKRRLIDILMDDLGVDRDLVLKVVAQHYSFESVDPTSDYGNKDKLRFIGQLLHTLPPYFYEISVRRKILPYELYTNGYDKLVVITPDPTHPDVHAVARAFQFHKYEVRYVSVGDWNEIWRQLAFDQDKKALGLDIEDEFFGVDKDEYEHGLENSLEDKVGSGKLIELVESILVDGVRTGASDVHVIPRASFRTEFHFRIDGRLTLWSTITDIKAESILSVVKDRGKNLDRFEKFLSQDGFAQRTVDNQIIRFRFSTMPIYGSDLKSKLESIVIRILRGSDSITTLESLGMDKYSLDLFQRAIRKPQGMVILTGPTGSGKSTTQLAALKSIMDPTINIITIEDPVEYLIEGCRQVKLNHKLDFEGALRGLLRHDPDIVMVGEMRDRITAEIAVKLANTGHLIFSTVHTNDTASAITRLYNMGIEPFLLAYTINIIVAQRLVRKLCDRCKTLDENVDRDLLELVGLSAEEARNMKIYKPVGCIRCIKGFRGRTGIYEALHLTKEMRQVILKSQDMIDEDAIRVIAAKNGMRTLRDSALNLVRDGITSLQEISGLAVEE
jgi:type IV pilus assembly protein PilB